MDRWFWGYGVRIHVGTRNVALVIRQNNTWARLTGPPMETLAPDILLDSGDTEEMEIYIVQKRATVQL